MIKYVIADVETTGFSPEKGDEIISIALIKVINNQIVDIFTSYYQPKGKLEPKIIEITGLSDDKLKGFTSFQDQKNINFIKEFISGFPIVAHNAPFDCRFLSHYKIINENTKVFDTLTISKNSKLGQPSNKLGDLAKMAGITIRAHDALSDCLALYQLIKLRGWHLGFVQ